MSVISERSHRRMSQRGFNNRSGRPNGGMSSRSVTGGMEIDHSFLLPQFSAAANEGVKIDLNEHEWGENTTVVTGNTSEHSYSGLPDRFYASPQTIAKSAFRRCSRLCWVLTAFTISSVCLLSAPLMTSTPVLISSLSKIFDYEWPPIVCEVDCQGSLLNMAGKSALLALAFYVLYWRRSAADMPRLFVPRAAFMFFVLFVLFAFWLFYVVRIVLERNPNFNYIVSYSLALLDVLLFIHCIWIFFELRQLRPAYVVTVVRDPDGEAHTHQLGQMSIQEAAVHVLQLYHTQFSSYNPYLDQSRQAALVGGGGYPTRFRSGYGRPVEHTAAAPGFKLYDIEGRGDNATLSEASARILVEAASRRRMTGHNDMFYEEMEWDKRFKKRKYRLVSCTEECFSHVQAINANNANHKVEPMDPSTTAKAVLGGIAKPLNRFLKFTRQQPNHLPKQVSEHLERCLAYRFSARTFLQRFFSPRIPPRETVAESKWSILCEELASSSLQHGVCFVLRSHNTSEQDAGVQLYCTVSAFPFFNITEQHTPDKASSKFALKVSDGL